VDHDAVVAWTQWPDLPAPDGVTMLSPADGPLTGEMLSRITFYVPTYMGGAAALAPAADMPNLRVLQMPNAGYDDAAAYVRPGMVLCNASGVHDESTAELAVALALAGRRGFADFAADQQRGRWRHARHTSLADSRIAVVGHGSIGRTIVRMLSGFAVTVVPFSRRGTGGALPVSELAGRIGEFDVVILVLPLTADSAGMFDTAMLGRMRDGALLVNVARGGIVDTDALVGELTAGRLSAALDVTDPEPLPAGHPLWSAPNCLITPHVGGDTTAFEPRMRALVSAQLERLVRGEPLANVVMEGGPAAGRSAAAAVGPA
jgi:phosphoglycerate dehydrogenase-like enzyme